MPALASVRRLTAVSRIALGLWLELCKARLAALVLFSTGVGYVLGSTADVNWVRMLWTLLGTGLTAGGANALNEWLEIKRDAQMSRTCGRPLPTRRLEARAAALSGVLTSLAGLAVLIVGANAAAAALALAAIVIYVALYTPLKTRTSLSTLIGAVVGALPPLVGWAAAGPLAAGGYVLALILFFWQIPHFLALAWLHHDDYARAGFRVLPIADATGRLTGFVVVLYTLVLLPLTLMPTLLGDAGRLYGGGALLLGVGLLWAALRLERQRTPAAARRLFRATVIYLPILLALLVIDRQPPV
jgi:protoheme IX farnesyltransferase